MTDGSNDVERILAPAREQMAAYQKSIVIALGFLAIDGAWAAMRGIEGGRGVVVLTVALVQVALIVMGIMGRRMTDPASPAMKMLLDDPQRILSIARRGKGIEIVGALNVRTYLRPPESQMADFVRMLSARCPNAAVKS